MARVIAAFLLTAAVQRAPARPLPAELGGSHSTVSPLRSIPQHPASLSQQRHLQSTTASPHLARLRADLLNDYDRGTYPFESIWNGQSQNRTGLPVEVGINFHRVFKVDVTSSIADLIVWFRQRWRDPRLVWNPDDYGGLQTVWFWVGTGTGHGGETSEIWTPDVELWNLESSLSSSLVDMAATVSSDGTVFWSRPGHLRPVCKFVGLNAFPFDTLSCTMEIGSWVYSGLYLRPIKMDGVGYSIGGSDTAGEAYAEFSLVDVECEAHLYPPYPALPEEDWPVLFYHISFARAWQPYVRGYLVLQILLNLASFASFWLPPNGGERVSLNISSVLASVASELVVASNVPAASEMTWFSRFSVASLVFTVMALFESAVVIYFYYHTGNDLIPPWWRYIQNITRKEVEPVAPPPRRRKWELREEIRTEDDDCCQLPHKLPKLDEEDESKESQPEQPESSLDGEPLDNGDHNHSSPNVVRFRNEDGALSTPTTTSAGSSGTSTNGSIQNIPRRSIRTIMGRDADDFKDMQELENNIRWQAVAKLVDEVSRILFPVAFAVFLGSTLTGGF